MLAEPSRLLADDHQGVDRVLEQLELLLEVEDVEGVAARVDLVWARLAVHIRAEHLHLFPAVLTTLYEREISDEQLPSAAAAQTTIAHLREDHDFFMRELANAVALMREIRNESSTALAEVARIVSEVKRRLVEHNTTEESQVYAWLGLLLTPTELATLASRIDAELGKRPPRFTNAVWIE